MEFIKVPLNKVNLEEKVDFNGTIIMLMKEHSKQVI
jgi:hypothetical protein